MHCPDDWKISYGWANSFSLIYDYEIPLNPIGVHWPKEMGASDLVLMPYA